MIGVKNKTVLHVCIAFISMFCSRSARLPQGSRKRRVCHAVHGWLGWALGGGYILYYTILYYTILYYTILYYTILYYTMIQSERVYLGGRFIPPR